MSGYDPAGTQGVPGAPGAVLVSSVAGRGGDVVLTVADIVGAKSAADAAADMTAEVARTVAATNTLRASAALAEGRRLRSRTAGEARRRVPVVIGALAPSATTGSGLETALGVVTGTVANETFTTVAAHGLAIGDTVRFINKAGMNFIDGATYTIKSVPTATTFTLFAGHGTSGGTQDMGTDGTATGFARVPVPEWAFDRGLLYPLGLVITAATDLFTSADVHGLKVGDTFTVGASTAGNVVNGTRYYVRSVPSPTTLTASTAIAGAQLDVTADGTATLFRPNPKYATAEGRAVQAGGAAPDQDFLASDLTVATVGGGAAAPTRLAIHTLYPGTAVEAIFKNPGGTDYVDIFVDGVLIDTVTAAQMTAAGVAAGSLARRLYTFPDARSRLLTQRVSGTNRLAGWLRPVAFGFSLPAVPEMEQHMFVGDSFTEGTGDTTQAGGFVEWLRRHLRAANLWRCGEGSTGYSNAGTRVALINRYQNDIIDQKPDAATIAMGINDPRATNADRVATTAAATTIWDAILTQSPATRLSIVGPFWPKGIGTNGVDYVDPNIRLLDSMLQAAATTRGIVYISPIQEGWITGDGTVAAPTGRGNSDQYISADGTHPSPAGHEYIGFRVAGHLNRPVLQAA